MGELKISNFKYGLDTRREQLTSQPGTLVTCENAHINPGGEVEKRKKFAEDGDLSMLDSVGDQGTFNVEAISTGLVTFGSALPYTSRYIAGTGVALTNISSSGTGGTLNITVTNGVITGATVNAGGSSYAANDYVTPSGITGSGSVIKILTVSAGAIATISIVRGQVQGQAVIVSAMPSGYTYQQLKHPALTDSYVIDGPYGDSALGGGYGGVATADAVNYDRTKHRITAIACAANYAGNGFASATFADGNTFLFYNGVYVRQSGAGQLFSTYSTNANKNQHVVYDLAQQFNELSGWGAVANSSSSTIAAISPTAPTLGSLISCRIGAPASSTFTMDQTYVSTSGRMAALTQPSTSVTAGGASTASFTVAGSGGDTYQMDVLFEYGTISRIYLTSSAVAWATNNNTTAAAIATAINLLTTTHGYSAAAVGAIVTVSAPIPATPTTGSYTQGTMVVTSSDVTAAGTKTFSTANYNKAFGQRGMVLVDQTWASGDTWSIAIDSSTQGNITVGKGNIAGQSYVSCMKLGQRMFICFGSKFAFSAINDLTGWEEHNLGAGVVSFVSQYGAQDSVQSFAHVLGKLIVFGKLSIQVWMADADPNQFALEQTLDNSGTIAPFSVQSVGDYDSYYLENSGVRSIRTKETTGNAFVDDIGSAIDLTIRAALVSFDASAVCSIVEPTAKQYWLYLNGTTYVLSNYPTSKILAWSTYKMTYQATDVNRVKNGSGVTMRFWIGDSSDSTKYTSDGTVNRYYDVTAGSTQSFTGPKAYVMVSLPSATPTGADIYTLLDNFTGEIQWDSGSVWTLTSNQTTFTPSKFVVYNNRVYVRATNNKVYLYGGTDNNTYDNCQAVVELPWLDDGSPSAMKQSDAVDSAQKGLWSVYASMAPRASAYQRVISKGSTTTPSALTDSTFDTGRYPYHASGTHFKLRAVSGPNAVAAKLGMLNFIYTKGQTK